MEDLVVKYWDSLVALLAGAFFLGRFHSRLTRLQEEQISMRNQQNIDRAELLASLRQNQVDQKETALEMRKSMEHQFAELRKDLREILSNQYHDNR